MTPEMGFADLPAASSPEAIDKVFELAREFTGSLEAKDAEEAREWLDRVRPYVRYVMRRRLVEEATETTSYVETTLDVVTEPMPKEMDSAGRVRLTLGGHRDQQQKCGLCGISGHNRMTCSLNPERIAVESEPEPTGGMTPGDG